MFIAEAQWPTLSLVNMKEAYYRFIKKGSEQEKEDVFSVQGKMPLNPLKGNKPETRGPLKMTSPGPGDKLRVGYM